jgi:hypothetical protein
VVSEKLPEEVPGEVSEEVPGEQEDRKSRRKRSWKSCASLLGWIKRKALFL